MGLYLHQPGTFFVIHVYLSLQVILTKTAIFIQTIGIVMYRTIPSNRQAVDLFGGHYHDSNVRDYNWQLLKHSHNST